MQIRARAIFRRGWGDKAQWIQPALASLLVLMACFGSLPLVARESGTKIPVAAVAYLREQARDPYQYVTEKFRDHDIVLLGEWHLGRQNLEFLQRLIPRLPDAGVLNLAYEFAYAKDQADIDRLLTAEAYDAGLANEIMLEWAQESRPYWPNQEYGGVFKAIWEVNRRLVASGDARRFRLIALGVPATQTQPWRVDAGKSALDRDVRNALMGGDYLETTNFQWLQITDREILKKGEKALVYAGSGHTNTRFFVDESPKRHSVSYGNLLHNYIGDRIFQIVLHGSIVQATGVVEEAARAAGVRRESFAFQVTGTPMGSLRIDRDAGTEKLKGYIFGSGRSDHFTLEDVTDGYVYLGAIADAQPVRLVPNFVTADNLRRVLTSLRIGLDRPLDRSYSPSEVEQLRSERMAERFKAQYAMMTPMR